MELVQVFSYLSSHRFSVSIILYGKCLSPFPLSATLPASSSFLRLFGSLGKPFHCTGYVPNTAVGSTSHIFRYFDALPLAEFCNFSCGSLAGWDTLHFSREVKT